MRFAIVILALLSGLAFSTAWAAGYEVNQRTVEFSHDALNSLVDLQTLSAQNQSEILEKLFSLSMEELIQKTNAKAIQADMTENRFFISGKNMRVDSTSAPEETTMIMLPDEGKVYNVFWQDKQYVELSIESIKQMQRQANEALKKVPNMEQLLEKMPPEARAQMRANLGLRTTQEAKVEVAKTGRKATVNGFECEEYRARMGTDAAQLFISNGYLELRASFDSFMNEFPTLEELRGRSTLEKVLNKIPDGWPVLIKEFKFDPFSMQPSLNVTEILKVTEKTLPADLFQVPAGFTQKAM